jgi:hypothetical protein
VGVYDGLLIRIPVLARSLCDIVTLASLIMFRTSLMREMFFAKMLNLFLALSDDYGCRWSCN